MYQPPFEITSKIIELISKISEKIGEINSLQNSSHQIKLRKENRIKTIHSSLAIENNSLRMKDSIKEMNQEIKVKVKDKNLDVR